MNYDHAYHAGNFADVLKHSVLCLALEHLNRKAKPYCVIDTHAGAGRYALAGEESRKTGEAARGIVRLWDPTAPFGLTQATSSPALAPYLDCLKAFGAEFSRSGGVPDDYPGSPLIAQHMMRPGDRLVAHELKPASHAQLRAALRTQWHQARDEGPKWTVEASDGYQTLRALLPPPERRGLVLIDPPFEQGDEFTRCLTALADFRKRWASGSLILWYPQKNIQEADLFVSEATALFDGALHHVMLNVHPGHPPLRLTSCGLVLVNPPFGVTQQMPLLLDQLSLLLGEKGKALTHWQKPSKSS